jgi:hypothetical protein
MTSASLNRPSLFLRQQALLERPLFDLLEMDAAAVVG